jgi:hypothetical protein
MKKYIRERIGEVDALIAKYAEKDEHMALFKLPAALEFLEQLRGSGIGVLGADGWHCIEVATQEEGSHRLKTDPLLQCTMGGFYRATPEGRWKVYIEDACLSFDVGDDMKDQQSEAQIVESIERTRHFIQNLPPDSVDFVEITLNI